MGASLKFVCVLFLVAALMSVSGQVRASQAESSSLSADSRAELDRFVTDVCGRDLVLLGEDANHGSGRTVEIKSVLVRRLVDECGFSQVLFESQFYEFPPLEKAMADGHATRAQFADAIGGLWSRTGQMQPLLAWLFDVAINGRVRVGGIDPQFGSATGHFAQHELGRLLAVRLPRNRRDACRQVFDRHHGWAYDAAHPFDGTEKARLQSCVDLLRKAMVREAGQDESARMALAYAHFVPATLDANGDAFSNARDHEMSELVNWYQARDRRKTIVWTATTHAAKRLEGDRVPMGHYLHGQLGDRMAVLGFSAVAGSNGGAVQKQAKALPELRKEMLEARFQSLPPDGLRYLSRTELAGMGPLAARALRYDKPQISDWSELLDGMIVLQQEQPAIQLAQ